MEAIEVFSYNRGFFYFSLPFYQVLLHVYFDTLLLGAFTLKIVMSLEKLCRIDFFFFHCMLPLCNPDNFPYSEVCFV